MLLELPMLLELRLDELLIPELTLRLDELELPTLLRLDELELPTLLRLDELELPTLRLDELELPTLLRLDELELLRVLEPDVPELRVDVEELRLTFNSPRLPVPVLFLVAALFVTVRVPVLLGRLYCVLELETLRFVTLRLVVPVPAVALRFSALRLVTLRLAASLAPRVTERDVTEPAGAAVTLLVVLEPSNA